MKISQTFISQRDGRQSEENGVIPLINVVFLILIFFMISGQIQKTDPIKVVPPQSINQAKTEREPDVVIFVGPQGEWYLNDDAVQLDHIQFQLEQLFSASTEPEHFSIQIKADATTNVDILAPLFTQIKQAGLTKVSIATQLDLRRP
jgi:biopolymer transport protein ExbD